MTAKIAVVTGAASGMGRLMATRLAGAGWTVAAVDLAGSRLDALAAEIGALSFPCDVGDGDQVESTAEAILARTGAIDRLVNAAGIAVSGPVETLAIEAFERSMEVNFLGTVRWVKAVLPTMIDRGEGELVLFASLAGWLPTPGMAAYTATKFAVVGFAETVAMESSGRGITVRCVCPGAVRTPMLEDIMARGVSQRLKHLTRVARPEQVISAIEASLSRRQTAIHVFPGVPTKAMWRARRMCPHILSRLVRRLSVA